MHAMNICLGGQLSLKNRELPIHMHILPSKHKNLATLKFQTFCGPPSYVVVSEWVITLMI